MTAGYRQIWSFVADESGATAIEYGLIAGLVAVGILIGLTLTGGSVNTLFDYVSSRSIEELNDIDEI
jgi:pilus assembly protein Flp/PilA